MLTSEDKRNELRMWLAVRTDIVIPKEKFGVQCGHGFGEALMEAVQSRPDIVAQYRSNSHAKIIVQVADAAALIRAHELCRDAGLPCALIEDEGRTVFNEPTLTVMAVGPCYKAELPGYVRRLRTYKEVEDSTGSESVPEATETVDQQHSNPAPSDVRRVSLKILKLNEFDQQALLIDFFGPGPAFTDNFSFKSALAGVKQADSQGRLNEFEAALDIALKKVP